MGDDERRKKSWREIDRQKDSSDHVEKKKSGARQERDKRSSAKYKRDLDKLFKSGEVPDRFKEMFEELEPEEGTPEAARKEAIAEVRSAEGFREFVKAVSEYRKVGWTWPDDEDLLIRMLDHPDERVVREVLEHAAEQAARRSWDRVAPLKNRLSTIETMSDDPRTRKAVDAARAALGD